MAHATLGSSMQRDIAAGRAPELDAIPGSVLRAAARHDLACPTIERLVAMIAQRAGVPSRRSPLTTARPRRAGRAPRRGGSRRLSSSDLAPGVGCDRRQRPRGDRLDDLLLGLLGLLVVLAVAEHAKVAGHAAVHVDRDPRQDLLALLQAQALDVEMRQRRCRRRCASGSRGRARPPPGRSARGSWRSCRCPPSRTRA